MIPRPAHTKAIIDLLEDFPVVGLIGARQVGKTSLARLIASERAVQANIFDLENPIDEARLSEPMLALGDLKGLVVLDEIQRWPDLFPVLRVLADRPGLPARFLILGSAITAVPLLGLGENVENFQGRNAG